MGICYVLSEPMSEALVKELDPGEARIVVETLETRKRTASEAREILEKKTYSGTRHVRQIKIGQWRIASLYVKDIDTAEVVQLCYIYNKNKNDEPRRAVLSEIDEAAERLFEQVSDWPPEEESDYLDTMRTRFPDV